MGAQKLANSIRRRKSSATDERDRKVSVSRSPITSTAPALATGPSAAVTPEETFEVFSTGEATQQTVAPVPIAAALEDTRNVETSTPLPISAPEALKDASNDGAPTSLPKQTMLPVVELEEHGEAPYAVETTAEERATTPTALERSSAGLVGDAEAAHTDNGAAKAIAAESHLPAGLAPATEPAPSDQVSEASGDALPDPDESIIAHAPDAEVEAAEESETPGSATSKPSAAQVPPSPLDAAISRISPPQSPIREADPDIARTPVRGSHSRQQLDTPVKVEHALTARPLSASDLRLQDAAFGESTRAPDRTEDDGETSTRRDSFETAERSPGASKA
jgi:hypothetical protein